MRTTLDLPDDLFMAVKKRAVELHQPLRALIELALRKELGEGLFKFQEPTKQIRWVTVAGDLPDVDFSSRKAMMEWV
jgi:hypothetical protein